MSPIHLLLLLQWLYDDDDDDDDDDGDDSEQNENTKTAGDDEEKGFEKTAKKALSNTCSIMLSQQKQTGLTTMQASTSSDNMDLQR